MNARDLSESLVKLGRDVLGYLGDPCEERRQAIEGQMAGLLIAGESPSAFEVYRAVKKSPGKYEPTVGSYRGGNVSRVAKGSLAG